MRKDYPNSRILRPNFDIPPLKFRFLERYFSTWALTDVADLFDQIEIIGEDEETEFYKAIDPVYGELSDWLGDPTIGEKYCQEDVYTGYSLLIQASDLIKLHLDLDY
jgi:hypothetical protein